MTVTPNKFIPQEYGFLYYDIKKDERPVNPLTSEKIASIWFNSNEHVISISHETSSMMLFKLNKQNEILVSFYNFNYHSLSFYNQKISKNEPILELIKNEAKNFPLFIKSIFFKRLTSNNFDKIKPSKDFFKNN